MWLSCNYSHTVQQISNGASSSNENRSGTSSGTAERTSTPSNPDHDSGVSVRHVFCGVRLLAQTDVEGLGAGCREVGAAQRGRPRHLAEPVPRGELIASVDEV